MSSAASAIDAGGVPFNLSGWLGGYAGQNDRVGMNATFLNASGASVGTASIAPVTSTDRGSVTKFLQRSATGTLPAGTRSIKVDLVFTWTAGDTTDGYADDVSLTVGANVATPALTAPTSSVPGFDHVFVVYMENEDYSGIVGNTSQAPYINSLLAQGTSLSQAYADHAPVRPELRRAGRRRPVRPARQQHRHHHDQRPARRQQRRGGRQDVEDVRRERERELRLHLARLLRPGRRAVHLLPELQGRRVRDRLLRRSTTSRSPR